MAANKMIGYLNGAVPSAGDTRADVDRSGDCTTAIITYGYGIGSHSAVKVDNSGNPILYDPGGSYLREIRGSGDYLRGQRPTSKHYINYQKSTGSEVHTFQFHTSAQDENILALRIQSAPNPGTLGCARGVSSVLNGAGPFKELGIY